MPQAGVPHTRRLRGKRGWLRSCRRPKPTAPPVDALGSTPAALPVGRSDGTTEAADRVIAAHHVLRARVPEQPPQQRLPLLSPGVPDPAAATSSGSPPIVPPSDGDTAGASSPDPTATFAGEGALSADTTVVPPSQPSALPDQPAKTLEVSFGIRIGTGSVGEPELSSEPDVESRLDASAQQRPAAYRFGVRDGKIDVLPEAPEPEDREFALDTYRELVAKCPNLNRIGCITSNLIS
jgi:hypothetical protein